MSKSEKKNHDYDLSYNVLGLRSYNTQNIREEVA
jgi:hypothetical protein